MNIKPINNIILQTKSDILSKYAQRYMKSQVKSTSFALERFFSETAIKPQDEQKLKKIGIKKIGEDIKEGIVISDSEYDYRVFSSDNGYMGFDIHKPDNSEVLRHFSVNDKSDKYIHSGDFSGLNIEDEMSRVLDYVSGKLYEAKRECSAVEVPYIPKQKITSNQIIYNMKNSDIKNAGFIGSEEDELIKSINDKFKITQELYKRISDGRTKWEVKKSYLNYLPQPVANKLGFKDIGPNGESISFFRTAYKNKTHNAITVTDVSGKERMFVVSDDKKSVQKNLPSKFVNSGNSEYRILITPDYYTQKEVDVSNLPSYLSCLNKAMDQFIEHTQNWFDKKEEIRLIKSNHDTANLDEYKDLLNDIHSNFENYRTKMRKYLRKTHKSRKFKTENNISTKLASTAVKFDNITPEGYDLRLSYPKVHDKNATQLLVMRGDKIENSFYILNDKLLRLKINDLNDKFNHYNQKLYYYDKKHLQESNLKNYLLLVQDKLHELNGKLDIIRKKQIENRNRYHIKTSKEQ